MSLQYRPTALESWVAETYKDMQIYTPNDLSEDTIAELSNIYISRQPIASFSYRNGKFQSITLDSRVDRKMQREHFYHEWCHLLRHAGSQPTMPKSFRELQEFEANNFIKYAAIPFHMLTLFNFYDNDLIVRWEYEFNVTPQLCHHRLANIYRRMTTP